jgi:hypothetical protein
MPGGNASEDGSLFRAIRRGLPCKAHGVAIRGLSLCAYSINSLFANDLLTDRFSSLREMTPVWPDWAKSAWSLLSQPRATLKGKLWRGPTGIMRVAGKVSDASL